MVPIVSVLESVTDAFAVTIAREWAASGALIVTLTAPVPPIRISSPGPGTVPEFQSAAFDQSPLAVPFQLIVLMLRPLVNEG